MKKLFNSIVNAFATFFKKYMKITIMACIVVIGTCALIWWFGFRKSSGGTTSDKPVPTNGVAVISNVPPPAVSTTNVTSAPAKLAENTNSPAVPTPVLLPAPSVTSLTVTQYVTNIVVMQQTPPAPSKAVTVDAMSHAVTSDTPPAPLFIFSPNMHQTVSVNGKKVESANSTSGVSTGGANNTVTDVVHDQTNSPDDSKIITGEPTVIIVPPKGHVRVAHEFGKTIHFGKMNVPNLRDNHVNINGIRVWEVYNPWDVTAELNLTWTDNKN